MMAATPDPDAVIEALAKEWLRQPVSAGLTTAAE